MNVNESKGVTISTLISIMDKLKMEDRNRDLIINDTNFEIIKLVIFIILCGSISLVGLVANIVNLIVFFRQGALSDSSTLCLFCLALADMGCLVPVFCNSAFEALTLTDTVGNFVIKGDYIEVMAAWIHIMFVQIAGWITAYITMERCVCVVFPFKAKSLFTAKRSLVAMVIIALLFTLSFVPTFTSLKWNIHQDDVTNRTSIRFVITEEFMEVTLISDYVNSLFLRTLVLVLVFVCNQITVFRVKLSKSWRKSFQNTTNDGKAKVNTNKHSNIDETITHSYSHTEGNPTSDESSNANTSYTNHKPSTRTSTIHISAKNDNQSMQRERRLIRMVTIISTIFLVCNIPDILAVYLLYFEPSFQSISSIDNLFATLLSIAFFLESFNSSVNIVVYYRMSTRYRSSFRQWLRLDKKY